MGEKRVCPHCDYETEVYDDREYECPECPVEKASQLRHTLYRLHGSDTSEIEGVILEDPDDPVVNVETRGEVDVCPNCGSPYSSMTVTGPSVGQVQPCGCKVDPRRIDS